MIHVGTGLARRLEAFVCAEWRELATVAASLWPEKGATCMEVGGGVALWLGEGGLVNVAAGVAMDGPIDEAEVRRVEDFYARHGAAAVLATCPFAHPSLFAILGDRGWRPAEFENVLTLEPQTISPVPSPLPPGIEIRLCKTRSERRLFGRTAALGFMEEIEPATPHVEFGEITAARTDTLLALAWAGDEPAGTGALRIEDGIAWLSADSTLPRFRGRGIQQALQRFRLRLVREAGCSLAVTEALPGGGSQRNMERLGFRLAYPHLQFVR